MLRSPVAGLATIVGITLAVATALAEQPAKTPDQAKIEFQWGVKIPLRDGVRLNATLCTPKGQKAPAPCIFTLTPYTDFIVSVYEIGRDGGSIYLTGDQLRARYREGLRTPRLVKSTAPLRYDFGRFTFVSRLVREGSRLRVTIGPANSIYVQKNYNGGGVVSDESIADARTVRVRLYHDSAHPSALYVPIGQPPAP